MSKNNTNPFLNKDVVFENSWKKLSIAGINEIIPHNFQGKEDFIQFYLSTNGGCFTERAFIYIDNIYEMYNDDYNPIEIMSFFHIPIEEDNEESDYTTSLIEASERRELVSEELEEFALFNFPFADNYADNDFWIDIQTGEIKYIDYEESYDPNDAIIVAPSFSEFCKNIQAKRR
ncbi:hypothetical protein M4I21_17400 [Cellulophaga sp. 20_2_10]|uniref:hypothetical protein n=1 Tax=Cellulophaga sp. 20_2_10 TaxID=2942476 RepID=UPI00201AE13B|nr:hypothetical protein [Cellulophaga sp. 20_2_10]MCL5247600.1 hypothetical protein [Cellulophaga sp. 20_2_10]